MEKPRLLEKRPDSTYCHPVKPEKLASRPEVTRMPSHQTESTSVELEMDGSLAVKANRPGCGEIGIVSPYNVRRPVGNGGLWSPGSSGARGTVGERRRVRPERSIYPKLSAGSEWAIGMMNTDAAGRRNRGPETRPGNTTLDPGEDVDRPGGKRVTSVCNSAR